VNQTTRVWDCRECELFCDR